MNLRQRRGEKKKLKEQKKMKRFHRHVYDGDSLFAIGVIQYDGKHEMQVIQTGSTKWQLEAVNSEMK